VGSWRSVGYSHNAFVRETLIDELAMRAKIDPIAYRLKLLNPDARKFRGPLALLQEKSAVWRNSLARNHAVGIACSEYHGTLLRDRNTRRSDSDPAALSGPIPKAPGFAWDIYACSRP
jgi:CO/xanthine dehydrogenase Mo-binding subunit